MILRIVTFKMTNAVLVEQNVKVTSVRLSIKYQHNGGGSSVFSFSFSFFWWNNKTVFKLKMTSLFKKIQNIISMLLANKPKSKIRWAWPYAPSPVAYLARWSRPAKSRLKLGQTWSDLQNLENLNIFRFHKSVVSFIWDGCWVYMRSNE